MQGLPAFARHCTCHKWNVLVVEISVFGRDGALDACHSALIVDVGLIEIDIYLLEFLIILQVVVRLQAIGAIVGQILRIAERLVVLRIV